MSLEDKAKEIKKGQIIAVHWVDQSSYTGPIESGHPAIQTAYGLDVGFFLEENNDWLAIAAERFDTDRTCYRHIFTFPKKCILQIDIIKDDFYPTAIKDN